MKRYSNYIFDLYGTLVDIWTDEESPVLWEQMASLYSCYGADYTAEALKVALEAAHAGIQVLIQATRGLDSFYAERSGLIIGY